MSTPTVHGNVIEQASRDVGTSFIWLELTGSCQLHCAHCYADSGPGGSHGAMSEQDWVDAITEAAISGVRTVQFIGGEPTTHPAFGRLVSVALREGLQVEVFSNLFAMSPMVWACLTQPGVRLATSYYSATSYLHDRITKRLGSHARTLANIREAVERGVPLRVGLIKVEDDQDIEAASAQLLSVGVPAEQIHVDDVRGVGRGVGDPSIAAEEDALCGNCASGVAAVLPDGSVHPCVFSRQARFQVGNLLERPLGQVLNGPALKDLRAHLATAFGTRNAGAELPDGPIDSGLRAGGPNCSPACSPAGNCTPVVNPGPCNPVGGHPPRPEPTPRPDGPVCGPYDRR